MSTSHPVFDILFPSLTLEESPFLKGQVPHVFCDVDGVLANFYAGMMRDFGISKDKVDDFLINKNGWDIITKKKPHFFASLPLLPDAKGLIAGLTQFRDKGQIKLSILTAIPNEWYDDPIMRKISTQDKIQWITRFFQTIPAKNVLVVRRQDKQKYARAQKAVGHPPAILIDDFPKNIREWEMAGGVGIIHTNSMNSLQQLYNYLN